MDEWLQEYKAALDQQEPLDDSWFPRELQEARKGDDAARRRILGSSLKTVLHIVEQSWVPGASGSFGELLQDANRKMESTLLTFSGIDSREYVLHIENTIKTWLDAVLKGKDPPGHEAPAS